VKYATFFATHHFSLKVHSGQTNHYEHITSLIINSVSEPVLFSDNSSVMITGRNLEDLCSVSNLVRSHVIKWFAANNLVINLDKIYIMKFITQNSSYSTVHIGYKEECMQ
jgi:hypothetical protein